MLKEQLTELEQACHAINAPDWLFEELSIPKEVVMLTIRPIIKGKKTSKTVIRVKNCNPYATGANPFKGGLRYHPGVTLELLESLALDMTLKCALTRLPFGGAKG